MTDKEKIRTNMTADQVNIDRCICDIDLVASGRKDCEEIRKHIRAIRRIFSGFPEEPTKFDIGDTIRPKGSKAEYTITSISGGCYHGKGWGLPIDAEKDYELVVSTEDVDACNIQYASIDGAIKAHAEDYSFNIESELFHQLTPEQQKMWRKEIERAVLSGAYSGLNLARDKRYEENRQDESVSEYLKKAAKVYEQTRNDLDVVSDNQMVERAFKAGADWQKQKDRKWLADNHKQIFNNGWSEGYEVGRDSMEEDMMKDAVKGDAYYDYTDDKGREMLEVRVEDVSAEEYNIEDGDKVKLIIIKEG